MITMDVVPAEREGCDVPHVLVLDTSSGAQISFMYGVQLYGLPGDGWEDDGTLLVWDPADAPDPEILAPFAVAIRQPAADEPLPFQEQPHNDRPIVIERTEIVADPSLSWLAPDGTPGPRICGAPPDVVDFRAVTAVAERLN